MKAVGDDHIDAILGRGDGFDLSLEEFDAFGSRLAGIGAGELKHLVGHIQPVRLAARAHALGRK